jgi:mannose-1-phosphate guanylyltransferase
MLPTDYRWNDVGSWTALTGVIDQDKHGNWPAIVDGAHLVAEDSSGCIAYGKDQELIALLGVEDLIVVRAGNATLVAPRDRAEDVRQLVKRIAKEAPEFL